MEDGVTAFQFLVRFSLFCNVHTQNIGAQTYLLIKSLRKFRYSICEKVKKVSEKTSKQIFCAVLFH